MVKLIIHAIILLSLSACVSKPRDVDVLIVNGQVFTGTDRAAEQMDIAVCGRQICAVSPAGGTAYNAELLVDAQGLVVSPGFIDPHTHTMAELTSDDKHTNLNYLYQGVTTVVSGNDGGGPADINKALAELNSAGIGTNLALYAGHGSIRQAIMGKTQRQATPAELKQMKALLEEAMRSGALGLSSGLYYVPGRFANTQEVIELAQVAARYGGIYDTHIRDESSFNIGFLAAIDEAIEIAEKARIHLHLAHVKALGVDVWGQSKDAIDNIAKAQERGVSISADQYPWLASGTNIRSAIVPKWAMADSEEAFMARLDNPELAERLNAQIADNIRRRGGADKLLITASEESSLEGQTLQQLANKWRLSAVEATLMMVRMGRHRVASYNMNPEDVERFMQQPWVVTSSDGTNGHPRKYASFPKKYRQYVRDKSLISLQRFIYASSGQTAKILGLEDRGQLKPGMAADILIFDPDGFSDRADFSQWNRLSEGVEYLWVNGQLAIDKGKYTGALAGQFVSPAKER